MVFLSIKNYKPEYIVDIATPVVVLVLGYEWRLFTNNETFKKKLQDAGDSGEPCYRFGMSINDRKRSQM
jgi:leucyl aminopeptidase